MSKVTIKDIAAALNISIGTVDRALHNRGRINKKTRSAVLAKAEEMGYMPNTIARSLSRRRTIKLGCIYPGEYEYFYPDLEAGIIQASKDLLDFNVQVIRYKSEKLGYEREIEFLQKVKVENFDGIAICPGHSTKLNDHIDKLIEQGIYVITMVTDAPESKRMMCVSTDPYNNGQIGGGLLSGFLNKNGKVAVLTGSNEVTDHKEKVRGFIDAINASDYPMDIIGVYEVFDSEDKAYETTKKIICNNPDVNGIYANTANNASICNAILDMNMRNKIILIGTDLTKNNIFYINNGIMKASIYQNPYLQGYKAVNALYQMIANKKKFSSHDYVKPEIITQYNVRYYKYYS